MTDKERLWYTIRAEALPLLREDRHMAKPVGGGEKVHFYLNDDNEVTDGDGAVIEKLED